MSFLLEKIYERLAAANDSTAKRAPRSAVTTATGVPLEIDPRHLSDNEWVSSSCGVWYYRRNTKN
jgi:hypothetical protein